MKKNDYVDWEWFKDLIRELRQRNNALMKDQGGANQVMISILVDLIAYDKRDWVSINPFSMNLHTGMGMANVDGKWKRVNVKKLFFTERLSGAE